MKLLDSIIPRLLSGERSGIIQFIGADGRQLHDMCASLEGSSIATFYHTGDLPSISWEWQPRSDNPAEISDGLFFEDREQRLKRLRELIPFSTQSENGDYYYRRMANSGFVFEAEDMELRTLIEYRPFNLGTEEPAYELRSWSAGPGTKHSYLMGMLFGQLQTIVSPPIYHAANSTFWHQFGSGHRYYHYDGRFVESVNQPDKFRGFRIIHSLKRLK